jgi:hypothetical protein
MKYRIVLYLPDPFTELQIPIGALVESGGTVTPVIASKFPSADYLSAPGEMLMRHAVQDLQKVKSMHLPMSFGPHFVLTDLVTHPLEDADPVDFVRDHFLP